MWSFCSSYCQVELKRGSLDFSLIFSFFVCLYYSLLSRSILKFQEIPDCCFVWKIICDLPSKTEAKAAVCCFSALSGAVELCLLLHCYGRYKTILNDIFESIKSTTLSFRQVRTSVCKNMWNPCADGHSCLVLAGLRFRQDTEVPSWFRADYWRPLGSGCLDLQLSLLVNSVTVGKKASVKWGWIRKKIVMVDACAWLIGNLG